MVKIKQPQTIIVHSIEVSSSEKSVLSVINPYKQYNETLDNDFYFHIKHTDTYIEHFEVNKYGKARVGLGEKEYKKAIQNRLDYYAEKNETIIALYHYDWLDNSLESKLEKGLLDAGVSLNPRDNDEIIEKLKENDLFNNQIKKYKSCLQATRFEALDNEGIEQRLTKHNIYNIREYQHLISNLRNDYITELKRTDTIDYDDMIIRATHCINKGAMPTKYKYILVDEFQDISTTRMNFLKAIISNNPDTILTVVGDDWQSIYRFSGSRFELITKFEKYLGTHTITKLEKTFRYNSSIAETAGKAIKFTAVWRLKL